MLSLVTSLYFIPVLISLVLLFLPVKAARPLVIFTTLVLSGISLYLFLSHGSEALRFTVPHSVSLGITIADFALLAFVLGVGIKQKNIIVGLLALVQAAVLFYLVRQMPVEEAPQFYIDKLSLFMFVLVNVVSGIIAIFSLKYIEEEDCSKFRKRYFMSMIFWFIAAMNLVVSADNLEYFYLFFELTTLASYLFIRFRKDEISKKNALTALWMNQIGGLAILGAMAYTILSPTIGAPSFTALLASAPTAGLMMPLALVAIAGLVKGAQYPFSKWLIGAMVAPTPVSALLHSSTMVKIAPFLMLRIAPAIKGTPVATVIICLTAFVFIASAVAALSQDTFKKILAHSTIALLALMILMAAVGSPVAIIASLMLILFHGLSKCMLFLNAGVLERVFHLKETSMMDRLGEIGPFTALITAVGFMSLLLPPFGAFIGKWFSIEALGASNTYDKLIVALVLVAIACGGAVLSLLYFKVLGAIISRSGAVDRPLHEKIPALFNAPIVTLLVVILLSSLFLPHFIPGYFAPLAADIMNAPVVITTTGWTIAIGNISLPILPILAAFVLLPVSIIGAMTVRFKNVDRAKEYMCGENINYQFSSFYFSTEKLNSYFISIGVVFFAAILLVAYLVH